MCETALQLLGATLRAFRQKRGLTQHQLATITVFKSTYISGIERGVRNVSMRNFFRLATALNVKPADLLRPLDRHLDFPSPKEYK